MFNQVLAPGPNLWITVLLALVPLIVLLCLLAVFRMTAWPRYSHREHRYPFPLPFSFGTPLLPKLFRPIFMAACRAFGVIDWITFWGVIIFNTLVLTGNFDRFQKWMVRHATADIRIQTIMLAWGGEVIRHNMAWTLIVLAYLVGVGLLYYFLYPSVMQK